MTIKCCCLHKWILYTYESLPPPLPTPPPPPPPPPPPLPPLPPLPLLNPGLQVHTRAWKPFARCQWAKRVRTSSLYQLQTDVYIPWHVIVVELTATGMKPLAHAQVKDPTVFVHDKVVLSQAVLFTNTGPGTIGVTPLPSNPLPSDPLLPDPSTSVGGATGVEAHSSTSLHAGA